MALHEVWHDTRGKAQCRSCHVPIEWAENVVTGKRHPYNGEIVPVRTRHDDATHRLIDVVDTSVTTSHFATCPDAKNWNRRR